MASYENVGQSGSEAAELEPAVYLVERGVVEPNVECEAKTQSLSKDVLGWLWDLLQVTIWATAAMGEEKGRASIHLLHNMLGSGEPIEVPKEWVMGAPDWNQGYQRLREKEIERAVAHALSRDADGEPQGTGQFFKKEKIQSLPDVTFPPLPLKPGLDQFFGSGKAWLYIRGKYKWKIQGEEQNQLEIEVFGIEGGYRDIYDWKHSDDPSQYSRQCRGWYKSFTLSCDWTEESIIELRLRQIDIEVVDQGAPE